LSRFTIDRNSHGLYQVRIENVTAFDAGTYRCVVRMYEMGGAETIAEFKSELIVLGEKIVLSILNHEFKSTLDLGY